MSAENSLELRRMENGGIWIVTCLSGDVDREVSMHVTPLAKAGNYADALRLVDIFTDPDSPDHHYTEYGFRPVTLEDLRRTRVEYLRSRVEVRPMRRRRCGCVYERDLAERWEVVEWSGWSGRVRTLGKGLTYAEAVTAAHEYALRAPDVASIDVPKRFKRTCFCLADTADHRRWRDACEQAEPLPGVDEFWRALQPRR